MQRFRFIPAFLFILLLAACTQKESSQAATDSSMPHAAVIMRDGTKVTGTVSSSTPSEMTVNQDGGGVRKILTQDVRSVEYGDTRETKETRETTAVTRTKPPAPPAAVPAPRPRPDETAVQTKTFEIPAGKDISVRNDETIDSSKAVEGQTYAAEVTSDVRDANGAVVIPRGANAQLMIKSISEGGKIKGRSDLVIALKSISINGRQYAVDSSDLRRKGDQGIGVNKRTGEYVGGGAALGAIIGAIAGGGKGAGIGAAAGAGGGVLAQILTRGKTIKIPAETLMTFKLDRSLRVTERTS